MNRKQILRGLIATVTLSWTLILLAGCAGKNLVPLEHGRPTQPAQIPRDLAAHDWAQLEWWYYTGHLENEQGQKYGFELTFFRRRLDNDVVFGVPARLFDDTGFMGNFAVVDESSGVYLKKGIFVFDSGPAEAETDRYEVYIQDFRAGGDEKTQHLKARMGDTELELELTPLKPASLHGDQGVVPKSGGSASYYLSFTRMQAEGTLVFQGREMKVSGLAWHDHEFGNLGESTHRGWDWWSLQLEDQTEYMIYAMHTDQGYSEASRACRIDAQSGEECIPLDEVQIQELAHWRSPKSKAAYPYAWRLVIPRWDLDVLVFAAVPNQLFEFLDLEYWEGSCLVRGRPADGVAYVELSGYTPSIIYSLKNGE